MKPLHSHSDKLPGLFFSPAFEQQQTLIDIEEREAVHAIKSRRLRVGDPIQITNGKGLLAEGVIVSIGYRPASIRVSISHTRHQSPDRIAFELASALPKGERLSTLIDMGTQLGMAAFIPLDCEFSAVQFQARMTGRWQRVIQNACKQSRRVYIPKIKPALTPLRLLDELDENTGLYYGDPDGESLYQIAQGIIPSVKRIIVMVGPEGGFSKSELALLRENPRAKALRASQFVLRTETAAIALLASVLQLSGLELSKLR